MGTLRLGIAIVELLDAGSDVEVALAAVHTEEEVAEDEGDDGLELHYDVEGGAWRSRSRQPDSNIRWID